MVVDLSTLSTARYGVLDRQLNNKERWLCFWALFLYGFMTSFMLFKASSVLPYIASDLSIASGDVGMVMTSFSIAGLILAYPGAWIMRKVGMKFSVMIVVVISIIGTALGCVATTSEMFLVSRAIEGVSYGLFSVMGPNLMPRLFPLKKLGLVMGVWSLWMPVGSVCAFVITPLMFDAFGWHSVWYVAVALQIVAGVVLFAFMKLPKIAENEIVDGDPTKKRDTSKNFVFAGLMMQVAFTVWCFVYLANINGLYPTFLQEVKGLSVFDSSMLPTVLALVTIALGTFAGIVSDKLSSRKTFAVVAYAVVAVTMFTIGFTEDPNDMASPWATMFIIGVCGSVLPMATRSIVPVLCPDPKKTDYVLATMTFVTCVAQVFGVAASQSVQALGWNGNAVFVLGPLSMVAAVIVLVFVTSDRKATAALREAEAKIEAQVGELAMD
ncbi:MFS transporter [Gordonibacter massiliensis (ex Traore et al. 2017)]|uniref:MFS transporter n=1 Tax=Gordonibacter massiliensis (ex Traore et al. 2017) TaxID=1841863 RepID=A0A842JKB2_9ACTN|nr:MFS transporter [Gordonibacter massiliensis (ex Traore et al. 2017)]MBC2890238.1 MFS transporter [Gordonibacter massiliensis (ex Traore et al. 2017)]